jgi:hypothetical protein
MTNVARRRFVQGWVSLGIKAQSTFGNAAPPELILSLPYLATVAGVWLSSRLRGGGRCDVGIARILNAGRRAATRRLAREVVCGMTPATCVRAFLATAMLAAAVPLAAASPRLRAAQSGDQLLAAAVAAPRLRSYSVPVHFSVRLHKPIGIRTQVEGTAYYRAPAQAALVITHASGLAGAFFRGAYKLDMVPQAWPSTYHVVGSSRTTVNGLPVLQLQAVPRAPSGDLVRVVFTFSMPALQPMSVDWQYTGGSSIQLAYADGRVGAYTLPQRATIAVDMPHDKLDADATYGAYALNAPVPGAVFSSAK